MASYNRVILVGNLTRDIELRYTPGGTAVTDIGVAVNDRRKTANGEWVEEATFVDVVMYGRTAEVASEYLGKGSPILIEGRLKLDQWETDGQKRSKLRVVCERMQMLGGRGGSPGGGSANSGSSSSESGTNTSTQTSASQDSASQDSAPMKSGDAHSNQNASNSAESSASYDTAGNREAQPSGSGPDYDDENIPF